MNIEAILNALRTKRILFHSEADFQFAFAWEIKTQFPHADVRLEYSPPEEPAKRIDILVRLGDEIYPIELKYPTKILQTWVDKEPFFLKNHGAQDLGKYDFIKDICRVETFKEYMEGYREGYAIWLTNDSSYWTIPRSRDVGYADFSVHHGALKEGKLQWGASMGPGSTKYREKPLILAGNYRIEWKEYSGIKDKNGIFKYSLVRI
jgi:hypothetical protein